MLRKQASLTLSAPLKLHVEPRCAGPLIHLDELGALVLLGEFPQLLVPEAV